MILSLPSLQIIHIDPSTQRSTLGRRVGVVRRAYRAWGAISEGRSKFTDLDELRFNFLFFIFFFIFCFLFFVLGGDSYTCEKGDYLSTAKFWSGRLPVDA